MPDSYYGSTIDASIMRLTGFYSGAVYDATAAPGGFDGTGYTINFVPSLRDVANVANAVGAAAQAIAAAGNAAGAPVATGTIFANVSGSASPMVPVRAPLLGLVLAADGASALAVAGTAAYVRSTLDAGVTAGTAVAQTATVTPAPGAWARGLRFTVTIGVGLTCADGATISVNGLGAKALVRPDGTAVWAGDLVAGRSYDLFYDGTNVVVLGLAVLPTGSVLGSAYVQNNAFTAFTTGYSSWPTSSVALASTVGTQVFSLTYTVRSATSLLELSLSLQLFVYPYQVQAETVSIFRDGNSTPVASFQFGIPASHSAVIVKTVTLAAGSAGSTTFTVRYATGTGSGSTVFFNGGYRADLVSGGPVLGGTLGSEFRVKEVKQ